MGKLTLEKIGRLSGVSRSTVSRVINNHPNVKPAVRERVLQIVAETGYHPDPAARSLVSNRSGIIGLIIPQGVQSVFDAPYFPRLIQGISRGCNARNYVLSLFLFQTEDDEAKLYPSILHNQLFDGLIVAASQTNRPLVPQLIANKIPFVLNGRHEDPIVSFVDADNKVGAYTIVSYLIRLGYTRIGTVTGPITNLAAIDRKEGYLKAHRDHGLPLDEDLIAEGDYTEISSYEATQRLLVHKPKAIFVASDTMAMGSLRALRDANIIVPDEIALVGFDDMPHAITATPPLTTVRQPTQRIGTLAVETLIDILENSIEPARRIIVPTELVIRASCGTGRVNLR